MSMATSADLQCKAILHGLLELEAVLNKPIANEALDLADNAAATRHKDMLVRLRKSLVQYLERSGSLMYVALIGHFSSGKSSTINSLLNLWDSRNERPATLNPTDKTVTLITNDKNANSLLGIVSHGSVPIRLQTLDIDLLNDLVLADTPGTGDPHLLEEMARDFLPICDLVLFFFSAASPLDSTDIPLLSELTRRLPFIPLQFIITRADELRLDSRQPLSQANYDSGKAAAFVGEVMSRIALLLQSAGAKYNRDDFLLIDNKTQFNVESLRRDLLQRADPANVFSRMNLHSHKISFFLTTSESLRNFFSTLLDTKIAELNRVVATAQQNINEYQEGVNITNNNLTKSWFDHHLTIQDLQTKGAQRIKGFLDLPDSLSNLEQISRLFTEARSDIAREASSTAAKIQQHARQTGFVQLQKELGRIQRMLSHCDLDTLTPQGHGLTPMTIDWSLSGVDAIPEYYLARRADDLRERSRSYVVGLARDIKRHLEEVGHAMQQRYIIDRCEQIVEAAQTSLGQDLDNYFQNVKVYHAGVFAMDTKASISKLGIGAELDQLEKEFTDEDKESIKLEAKQALFPSFDDAVAGTAKELAGIAEQVRLTLNEIGNPQIDSPPALLQQIELLAGDELFALVKDLKSDLQQETNDFIGSVQDKLAGVIGTALLDYDSEKAAAQRTRQDRYFMLVGVLGIVSLVGYVLFSLVKRPVGSSLLELLGWGILIEIAGNAIGFGVAFFRDKYPQTKTHIKQRHTAAFADKIRSAISEAIDAHRFAVLEVPVLGKRLERSYVNLALPSNDAWQSSIESVFRDVRRWSHSYRDIRGKYLAVLEGFARDSGRYFEDAQQNLATLKLTAKAIRERAIEPSFRLLARTSEQLQAVRDEITAIRFM